MGLPVQDIDTPWDVDVMQKIHLDERRNAVADSYLKQIYAEVLSATHHMMKETQFGETWVKHAIEQTRVTPDAIRATFKGRYSAQKGVFASMDNDANSRARAEGYYPVDAQALSKKEEEAFRRHVGIEHADVKFGTPPPPRSDHEAEAGSIHDLFAKWVTEKSKIFNLDVTVRYFDEPANQREADCQVGTTTPVMRFNEATLGEDFFQEPHGREEHWNLLLHEVAHAMTNSPEHGEEWGNASTHAGALAAVRRTR